MDDEIAPTGDGRTDRELIRQSLTIRHEYGLSTDEAHIRRVIADPASVGWDELGLPFTPAELDVIARANEPSPEATRSTEQGLLASDDDDPDDPCRDPIEQYGAAHPGEWAGSYRYGVTIRVGFTRDGPAHLAALRRLSGAPLQTFEASHTLAELEAIEARVADDWKSLAAEGIDVQWLGIDVPANVVEVGIADPPPAAERSLRRRYGRPLRVVAGVAEPARPRGCGSTAVAVGRSLRPSGGNTGYTRGNGQGDGVAS